MHLKRYQRTVSLALVLLLCWHSLVAAQQSGGTLTDAGVTAVGGFSAVPGGPELQSSSAGHGPLAVDDIRSMATFATQLLATGVKFRATQLQILSEGKITNIDNVWNNYEDFNGGPFDRFCQPQLLTIDGKPEKQMVIDSFGYCVNSAGTWPYAGFDNPGQPIDAAAVKDVRNRLIRARDLFAFLALAEPAHMTVTPPAQTDNEPTCFAALRTRFPIPDSVPVRELGKAYS